MIRRVQSQLRHLMTTLLKERLDPERAAAAVFLGVLVGIVPIYGFQSVAALFLATVLRLNKPLTLGATFVNNPLLQPLIVISSIQIGHRLLGHSFRSLNLLTLSSVQLKQELTAWVVGSVAVGVLVGAVAAIITGVAIHLYRERDTVRRDRIRFVNRLFANSSWVDRGFVRWKLRLDRIFDLLGTIDLGSGLAVDLGCGFGIALGLAAYGRTDRRLVGCDLDQHRIEVARQSLAPMNAELSVADVRNFELPPADLFLILDVLQYLNAGEQLSLLRRCCAAVRPQGKLIFRVHDRERGLLSKVTMAFDRLVFSVAGVTLRPVMLPAEQYRLVLKNAGLQVEEHRVRNRLPLVHLVFIAKRPPLEIET